MPTCREYGHVPLLVSATFDMPTPSVRPSLAPSAPHHREADDNADPQGRGGGEPATKRVKTAGGIIKAEEVEVDAAGGAGEGAMAEEDAMSEVKEEEAGRPPLLPMTESTPQRVAGATDAITKAKGAAVEGTNPSSSSASCAGFSKVKDKCHRRRRGGGGGETHTSSSDPRGKAAAAPAAAVEGTNPSPTGGGNVTAATGAKVRKEHRRLGGEGTNPSPTGGGNVTAATGTNERGGDFRSSPERNHLTARRGKCLEKSCPNHGGKCREHKKMYSPFKANDCPNNAARNDGGLCKERTSSANCPRASSGADDFGGGDGHAKGRVQENVDDRSLTKGKKPPHNGPTNDDILLTCTDQTYKSIMNEECDAWIGTGDKLWASEASRKVWEKLKTLKPKGNAWIINPNSNRRRYQRVTEEEALTRIKTNVYSHRNDRRKFWEKKNGAGVDKPIEGGDRKKRSSEDDGDASVAPPRKKQKECHVGRNTRNSMGANFDTPLVTIGATCRQHPKLYVGMYIFGLLQKNGWTGKEKKEGETNRIQIIYCPKCDMKNAVEGEDKFTGYPALAQWAYANGLYKDYVVDTVDGRIILEKVGILDEPYSIFEKKVGDPAQGENYKTASVLCHNDDETPISRAVGHPGPGEISQPVQNDVYWPNVDIPDNQTDGEETEKKVGDPARGEKNETASVSFQSDDERPPSRVGGNPAPAEIIQPPIPNDDRRPIIDIADNQAAGEETQSTSVHVQINDDEVLDSSQQTKSLYDECYEMFLVSEKKLADATLASDITGMAFYSHLVHYLEAKASRRDFCLGSDRDIIAESIESFEDKKAKLAKAVEENQPTQNVHKLFLNGFIRFFKEKLPLF